jgi:hypothetical protein
MIDPLGVTALGSAVTAVGGIVLGTEDDKAQAAKKAEQKATETNNEKEDDQ